MTYNLSRYNYSTLATAWTHNTKLREDFFIGYAVEGPMVDPSYGQRAGLPVDTPIPGPVHEPSPLNNRWVFNPPDVNIQSIL